MATTIKSTELDFFEIKENLKLFLQQKEEFKDYDFEGSALSNLLDVLAHNTHFNALIANFSLNESYLSTAQLRNSVVSLAESLGYIPSSMSSAQSTISLTINLSGVAGLEQTYALLPGQLVLRGSNDDVDYIFTNRETLVADAAGTGIYTFKPFADPESEVRVYEGIERSYDYLVDGTANEVYVIPDESMDISTAIVKVYDNQSAAVAGSGEYGLYTSVFKARTISESSRLHILRESPNKYFELTFGDNNSLGQTPLAGNVVDVNYLRTQGAAANGVANLKLAQTISFGDYKVDASNVTVTVKTRASGGGDREDIESIRKKAPFQYAAQNRMITPLDYEALILREYNNYITDIIVWGGEDDVNRDYGSVYTSIVWDDDLSSTTIGQLRNDLRSLVKDLAVTSFQLKFVPPSETYISSEVFYQFNPELSAGTESTVNAAVRSTLDQYFVLNTGKFNKSFRRSRMLTQVDDTDPSILSSRATVKMNKRITPILTLTEDYLLSYPVAIKEATDVTTPVVKTTIFKYNNKSVYIRNKLTDRVKVSPEGRVPVVFDALPSTTLEMVDLEGNVMISNIGSYSPQDGTVSINALTVQSTQSANKYIKVFATPANESAVETGYSNILKYDAAETVVKPVTILTRD